MQSRASISRLARVHISLPCIVDDNTVREQYSPFNLPPRRQLSISVFLPTISKAAAAVTQSSTFPPIHAFPRSCKPNTAGRPYLTPGALSIRAKSRDGVVKRRRCPPQPLPRLKTGRCPPQPLPRIPMGIGGGDGFASALGCTRTMPTARSTWTRQTANNCILTALGLASSRLCCMCAR